MKIDLKNNAQIERLIAQATAKFNLSAKAWEQGNNSGNSETCAICEKRSERLAKEAEEILAPFGMKIDYPGLYPSFAVKHIHEIGGESWYSFYSVESAVRAAVEQLTKQGAEYAG